MRDLKRGQRIHKKAQMNKEQIRALLGQLIQLQEMLNAMERDGFSWETVQTIKDNLRLVIMDPEKAATKRATHARNAHFHEPINYKEGHMDTILHQLITIFWTPWALIWRLVAIPANTGKGGQVKHASDIFPARSRSFSSRSKAKHGTQGQEKRGKVIEKRWP